MTVGELIDTLEGVDENLVVLVAYQPNYPMQINVTKTAIVDDCFYIAQDDNGNDYLSQEAGEALGWYEKTEDEF